MASNELAAILARRRAKEGGASVQVPVFENNSSVSNSEPTTTSAASGNGTAAPAAAAPRASIAERIARLKQQSATAGGGPVPTPVPIAINRPSYVSSTPAVEEPPAAAPAPTASSSPWSSGAAFTPASEISESASDSSTASAVDANATGNRRTSNRIQELQGSLGINVNPFRTGGPPGGFRKPSGGTGGGNSIMTTGEQYAQTHGSMGIAMPGMGAAIPMPGLAKFGTRIPGMAPSPSDAASNEAEESASAAASLEASHATMSRAAGPKRRGPTRPPPGAVRIPGPAIPVYAEAEPQPSPSAVASLPVPAPVSQEEPSGLFGGPSTTSDSIAGLFGGEATTVAPVATPMPQLSAASTPAATLVQPAPTPALFSSTAAVEASLGNLNVSEVSFPPAAAPTPAPASTPALVPTPSPAPVSTPSLFGAPAPAAPSPVGVPLPVRQPSASLFGAGSVANDDDSSDSEWSDDESSKPKPAVVYGTAVSASAAPAPAPIYTLSPAPVPVAHSASSGGRFGASDDSESLFGGPSTHHSVSQPAPAPAPVPTPVTSSTSSSSLFGVASAPAGTAVIRPPQQYNSLFGADDDSDSDESDDEGGLFGTGLPTSR